MKNTATKKTDKNTALTQAELAAQENLPPHKRDMRYWLGYGESGAMRCLEYLPLTRAPSWQEQNYQKHVLPPDFWNRLTLEDLLKPDDVTASEYTSLLYRLFYSNYAEAPLENILKKLDKADWKRPISERKMVEDALCSNISNLSMYVTHSWPDDVWFMPLEPSGHKEATVISHFVAKGHFEKIPFRIWAKAPFAVWAESDTGNLATKLLDQGNMKAVPAEAFKEWSVEDMKSVSKTGGASFGETFFNDLLKNDSHMVFLEKLALMGKMELCHYFINLWRAQIESDSKRGLSNDQKEQMAAFIDDFAGQLMGRSYLTASQKGRVRRTKRRIKQITAQP